MRVYLESLGCKLNQCERDHLAGQFALAGHEVVMQPEQADLCLVNTCAVTQAAAGKSRRRCHALRRLNPAARLVVTGCYVESGQDSLHADLTVGNADKENLVAWVEAQIEARPQPTYPATHSVGAIIRRTRPLVKIQDGCDNQCAYCIVHILRGRQRSRPRADILAEIELLARQGYHEVVLTGVHVGSYGRDSGDSLSDLVRAILAQEAAPERLRLSSVEPCDLNADFFKLWQDPRLCRHLHLPLQSGCDATLQRMNRHYTTAQYADWVAQARTDIPGLAVTTDLIVGLPGETEQEFALSAAFVEQMAFARIHIFTYSARPGTSAAAMPDQVPAAVAQERARTMQAIAQAGSRAFRQRWIGHTLPVLWETRRPDGRWSGLTDHYLRVYAPSSQDMSHTLTLTRLLELDGEGLSGQIADEPII